MEMKVEGSGEVRRLHIIYFLSRMGRLEQPHLIRIQHLAPNGVYLRDVKRWLSDLRGKELADSFAWSYKRRYKTGYLWQDLLDDDLITPISDNEFVLKGSEIPSSDGGKEQEHDSENGQTSYEHKSHDTRLRNTSPPSPEIIEESIQFGSESSSASMEYSTKHDVKSVTKDGKDANVETVEEVTCDTSLLSKPRTKKMETSLVTMSQNASNGLGRKSQRTASSILRNLTTCCAADTVDSVTVPTQHRIKKSSLDNHGSEMNNGDMCTPLSKLYQQQRIRNRCEGVSDSRKKMDNGYSLGYKPLSYPICSQCGKPFKPEKLHSHMKSCRGMKRLARNAAASTSGGNGHPSVRQDI